MTFSQSPGSASQAGLEKFEPSGTRIPVLDGMWGIAVLVVMFFHFWVGGTVGGNLLWQRVYAAVAGMGWAGVDLFFVLSGFLITGILYDSRRDPRYFRTFYGRRTVRTFPLYYASLALFFVGIPFFMMQMDVGRGLAELQSVPLQAHLAWAYLLNWYEGLRGFNSVPHPLHHFWSLAIEEQFYLVWPLLVLKMGRRRLMAVCFALMGMSLGLRAVLYGIHLPYAAYTWTLCRADSLAIGSLVALAARDAGDWRLLLKWARRLALPALIAIVALRVLSPKCVAGPGASPTVLMSTLEISFTGVFFGSCLAMAVCLRKENRTHRLLGCSFLRFFGKYSYCLYVCHMPIIVVLAKAGVNSASLTRLLQDELLATVSINGIALAVSIAVAFVSWHLFEKQWLKLKNLPALRGEARPSKIATLVGALYYLPDTMLYFSDTVLDFSDALLTIAA